MISRNKYDILIQIKNINDLRWEYIRICKNIFTKQSAWINSVQMQRSVLDAIQESSSNKRTDE